MWMFPYHSIWRLADSQQRPAAACRATRPRKSKNVGRLDRSTSERKLAAGGSKYRKPHRFAMCDPDTATDEADSLNSDRSSTGLVYHC